MSGEARVAMTEVDFAVIREDFSRYLVEDGTTVKVKIVVRKIFKSPLTTAQGYPTEMSLDSVNAISALVPERLKRQPKADLVDPTKDIGREMKFDLLGEQRWQEYMTPDGMRVLVKPVVTKVLRYDKYNIYGEPVYNVIVQAITNVEKIASTS